MVSAPSPTYGRDGSISGRASASRLVAGSLPAANDHAQTWTDTERGQFARFGACRPALGHDAQVGVRVNLKGISKCGFSHPGLPLFRPVNWPGLALRSFSRISYWPLAPHAVDTRAFRTSLRIVRNLRVRAVTGCASLFHSSAYIGSRRSRAHTLTVQPRLQLCGDRAFKHRSCLSVRPSLDGFKTIEKAFDEWTKTNFGIGQK